MKTGDIQNVNVDSAGDFNASYSILGDLKDGTNDMTDENLKINGKYKFV